MLRIYTYKACSNCRYEIKWLNSKRVPHEELAIRITPPTADELHLMLTSKKSVRSLLNTSSADYRALEIKDKLDAMPLSELFKVMRSNGNLVKRPFAIDAENRIYLLGFKEAEWEAAFAK